MQQLPHVTLLFCGTFKHKLTRVLMQSSGQYFQAAHSIASTHRPTITLRGLFHTKEKVAWGQRPDPWPWISVLQAIIRGSWVTLPFFLAITLDQRMCPSSLHFGTLHKGDPRGQGMASHKTALSLWSELSVGRSRCFRERLGWKLDSLEVLGSLKLLFKETRHFAQNSGRKSKPLDQFLEKQSRLPINFPCHKDA